MNRRFISMAIAARVWILTSWVFALGWFLYTLIFNEGNKLWISIIAGIVAAIGSIPVLIILAIVIPFIEKKCANKQHKIYWLVFTCLLCTMPYGFIGTIVLPDYSNETWINYLLRACVFSVLLFCCTVISLLLSIKKIFTFFSIPSPQFFLINKKQKNMETEQTFNALPVQKETNTHKTLIKGIITGILILIMLIPTLFVSNLVTEREQRQKEIVKEVSNKWASGQTLAGPYIYIPYTIHNTAANGKTIIEEKHLLLLPDNLNVAGNIIPEIRQRSIYKVLLYKSNIKNSGDFVIRIPKEINTENIQWQEAKICFGITDVKGIEEKIIINTNAVNYELSPGLPTNDIDANGLSAPINLSIADIGKKIDFALQLKLKGSEQLHFVPLSGNSQFTLQSSWHSPSFDGNNLPGEREVNEKGFSAKWTFNKASLPFGTTLKALNFNKKSISFGVTMLQPADQYAKTMRSVKYAILFIGLTFSLFFIVELLQNKPVHPLQYILVGLSLVIFYTLLLAISEFILFDYAYAIAATATITLITLYAKSHFQSWKTASLFASILSTLYGFIFVLIRLEDTALLVGSIGLFIVLALVMYASRKINWYNPTVAKANLV